MSASAFKQTIDQTIQRLNDLSFARFVFPQIPKEPYIITVADTITSVQIQEIKAFLLQQMAIQTKADERNSAADLSFIDIADLLILLSFYVLDDAKRTESLFPTFDIFVALCPHQYRFDKLF